MGVPQELKFTKDHEWVKREEALHLVGVTAFAQEELGEIVFCELPEVGTEVQAGDSLCVVESTKAASDVYAPISGKVVAVNNALQDTPSLINQDPYNTGWMVKLEATSADELEQLLDASQYEELIG